MGKLCNLKEQLEGNTILTDFLDNYPNAQVVKETLWELLIAAMGSDHADMWDGATRAEKLFFYEQMGDLIEQVYKVLEE